MTTLNRVRITLPALILLLVSVFVLLYRVGDAPLHDWDEGIYATIAGEMAERGDYLRMTLMGQPWLEKPLLPFWLNTLSFKLFGLTEFAVRFFPALAGIGCVLLLYGLGRRLFSWYVGFWAGLLFALSPIFLDYHMARSGNHDVLFLFWLLAALYAFVRSWQKDAEWWLILSGVSAGFAIFTRGALGIFGIIIPLLTHALLVLKARLRRTPLGYHYRWYHWVGFALSTLVIGGWWHVFAYLVYREQFITVYIKEQFFSRITGPLQGHAGPWWFYARYLWNTEPFVTAAAALMSLWWLARYSIAFVAPKRVEKIRFTAAIILLMVWVASFALVISFMQTKLSWYVLGMVPALYLIAVSALKHSGVPRAFATIGVVALLVFYGMQLLHWKPTEVAPARDAAALIRGNVPENGFLILYRTAAWNFGRIAPATYWYLRYQGGVQPIAVDRENLEYYLEREETYHLWLMQKDVVADLEGYKEFSAFTRRDIGDWALLSN